MKRFKNILVGVDLSAGDRFVGDELAPPTEEGVERHRPTIITADPLLGAGC